MNTPLPDSTQKNNLLTFLVAIVALLLGLSFLWPTASYYREVHAIRTTVDLVRLHNKYDDLRTFPCSMICLALAILLFRGFWLRLLSLAVFVVCLVCSFYISNSDPVGFILGGLMLLALIREKIRRRIGVYVIIIAMALQLIIIPNFLRSGTRSLRSRAQNDMRAISTALEAYYVDHNAYPACTLDRNLQTRWQSPTVMPALQRHLPTGPDALTTPVAYIEGLPVDPFRYLSEDRTYAYYKPNERTWILVSPGPDVKFDLNWPTLQNLFHNDHPSTEVLIRLTYDPSNGVDSTGDIWRIKQ